MTDADFADLHALIGQAPVGFGATAAEAAGYVADLEAAKTLMGEAYGFSDVDLANW